MPIRDIIQYAKLRYSFGFHSNYNILDPITTEPIGTINLANLTINLPQQTISRYGTHLQPAIDSYLEENPTHTLQEARKNTRILGLSLDRQTIRQDKHSSSKTFTIIAITNWGYRILIKLKPTQKTMTINRLTYPLQSINST